MVENAHGQSDHVEIVPGFEQGSSRIHSDVLADFVKSTQTGQRANVETEKSGDNSTRKPDGREKCSEDGFR